MHGVHRGRGVANRMGRYETKTQCQGGVVYIREVTMAAGYAAEIVYEPVKHKEDVDAVCEDSGSGCAQTRGCYPVVKLWVRNTTANAATVSFSRSGHSTVTISLPASEAVTFVTSDWFSPGTFYATNADHGRIEVFEDTAPSTHVVDAYLSCSACADYPSV